MSTYSCRSRVHGLPYIALRYGNVYGPRQDPDGEAGVVTIFTEQMITGQSPTIFGDGEQIRDYVFVADVVRANLLALERLQEGSRSPQGLDERAYNIGTGRGTSVNGLFAELWKITGFVGEPDYGPERQGELRKIVLNCDKARQELSWEPTVSLQEGLQRTVEHFQGRPKSKM